jgi:hypothetical protein
LAKSKLDEKEASFPLVGCWPLLLVRFDQPRTLNGAKTSLNQSAKTRTRAES